MISPEFQAFLAGGGGVGIIAGGAAVIVALIQYSKPKSTAQAQAAGDRRVIAAARLDEAQAVQTISEAYDSLVALFQERIKTLEHDVRENHEMIQIGVRNQYRQRAYTDRLCAMMRQAGMDVPDPPELEPEPERYRTTVDSLMGGRVASVFDRPPRNIPL